MICSLEKGHDGLCVEGEEAGTCKKTAEKWFAADAPEEVADDVYTEEEMQAMSVEELADAYRRTNHPVGRREAVEWARAYVEARDAS